MQTLTDFLTGLLQGEAIVASELQPFSADDRERALAQLQVFYEHDKAEMPGSCPPFNAGAALWAAEYLYRALQLLLLRNLGEGHIPTYLDSYPELITAEAIYSADLTLRNLPPVLGLAQRLSPEDPLVMNLKQTASTWSFSSVGCEAEPVEKNTEIILAHPALKIAYADRIIMAKDMKRAKGEKEKTLLLSVMGNYTKTLLPEFEALS